MNKFISTIACLLIVFHVFGQNAQKHVDSIHEVINSSKSDSVKAKLYYNESKYFLQKFIDINKSHQYVDSAMHYAKISKYKDVEDRSHLMYGLVNRLEGNYDVAMKHLNLSLENYKDDVKNKSNALFQIAAIYKVRGQYEESLKLYSEMFNLFEGTKDSLGMASTLNSIASVYGKMKKNDKAIENFNIAKDIFKKIGAKRSVALAYFNISLVYLNNNDTLKARENVLMALPLFKKVKDANFISLSLCRLGNTYLKSDSKKTLAYFLDAKTTLEKKGTKRNLIDLYQSLGYYYKYYNNNSRAVFYYNKAILLAEELGNLSKQKEIYDDLSQIYKQKNDFANAYKFQSKYLMIKDSLFNKESVKEIHLLQTQFETVKKDKEIAQQKLALQQNEIKLLHKKNQYYWALGGTLFFLITSVGLWLFFKQRQETKNKEILTLEAQQEVVKLEALIDGEEKERQRLAQDLHDGINGDLAVIKYKISAIESAKLNAKEKIAYAESIKMLDSAVEQVRRISHNLAPPSLHNFDLIEAIQQFCKKQSNTQKVAISFQFFGKKLRLTKEIETVIYRIIQELVNNIIKHANATEALVQLNHHKDKLVIAVEDNGQGFNLNAINQGIGLENIKSRINFLQAELDISSSSKGTSFTIDIDLTKIKNHD